MVRQGEQVLELQDIAASLVGMLARLDACGQSIAAVYVQHALDVLRQAAGMPDEHPASVTS
ncbi:hypothetical protein WBP06_16765 [Novosphingobium sp. BL-8H]|uniref:hypothetical protein n=1 Tax=Novosphingobium sp. BL-8H TaxID=3127640 RepID=UPI0037576E31